MTVGTSDIIEIGLGSGNEKGGLLIQCIEATKVDIGPIHDIKRSGLQDQFV